MSVLNMPEALVSRWALQGDARDGMGRYDGVAANMAGWPASFFKNLLTCGEFNGNNSNINLGDVTQLNAVSAFTVAFWMNQDVIDQQDIILSKYSTASNRIQINAGADGNFYFMVANGAATNGRFDYSTVISAGNWYHVAMVFDGTQTGDANRLIGYVDGVPVTLVFMSPIPATTADMSGANVTISAATNAFDGRLHDMRLYNRPLSRDIVNTIIHEPAALV